jgi:hypothetical protein
LFPISTTKDKLFAKNPDPAIAGLRVENSRSDQVSRKTPNRRKPVCTPAKAGPDWYMQIFFFLKFSSFLTPSFPLVTLSFESGFPSVAKHRTLELDQEQAKRDTSNQKQQERKRRNK